MNSGDEFFCGSISDDYRALLEAAEKRFQLAAEHSPSESKGCSSPLCEAPSESKGCSSPACEAPSKSKGCSEGACPEPISLSKGCSSGPQHCPHHPHHPHKTGARMPHVPGWSTPPPASRPRVY